MRILYYSVNSIKLRIMHNIAFNWLTGQVRDKPVQYELKPGGTQSHKFHSQSRG